MISSALAFEMGSAPIPSIASSFHLRAYHAPRLVAVSASKLSPSAPAPPLAQGLPAEGGRAAGQHPRGHPRAVPRPPPPQPRTPASRAPAHLTGTGGPAAAGAVSADGTEA